MDILNVRAAVLHACGRYADAVGQYRTVLDLADARGDRYAHVSAMAGLAAAYRDAGTADEARDWAGRALAAAETSGYRLLADRARAVLTVG